MLYSQLEDYHESPSQDHGLPKLETVMELQPEEVNCNSDLEVVNAEAQNKVENEVYITILQEDYPSDEQFENSEKSVVVNGTIAVETPLSEVSKKNEHQS